MTTDRTVDAILPAGGRIKWGFAARVGTKMKALIPFEGQTVLERALASVRETGRVRRVVVIGPEEIAAHPAAQGADAVLADTGSAPTNIFRGLECLRTANGGSHADRVLIMTTDLPFVTSEAVSGLLEACPREADISLPVIGRAAFDGRFPGAPRRYARLLDGEWLIGGAALIEPTAIDSNHAHIKRAFAARKSVLALASLLGLRFLVRCIRRRLTVADIERRCEEILRCTGRAVRGCAPELAYDIDWHKDYRYAVESINCRDRAKAE
ncbi:MAG: NTP transferase domain-containing protein [Armatimonadota bacterium]|jgi:CTP:molybdopterin cytidylyltransferase MocA